MSNQVEEIGTMLARVEGEYIEDNKVYRTTCQCMGDDPLTFYVDVDEEHPEVYLSVDMKVSTLFDVWDRPRWSYPFRRILRRIKYAWTLLTKGYVEMEGAFIFRGEEHIDGFTDAVQSAKNHMKDRIKEIKDGKR